MKRLKVMVITAVAAMGSSGCAASAYKFTCAKRVCEVETSGPAKLDFQREFGQTIEVVDTGDGRVTLAAGAARTTLRAGETRPLGPVSVRVKNVKGEKAYFSVRD